MASTSSPSVRLLRDVGGALLALLLCGIAAILFVGPPASKGRGFDTSTIVPSARASQQGRRYQGVDFRVLSGFPYGEDPLAATPAVPVSYDIPSAVVALSGTAVAITGFMLPLDVNEEGVRSFLLNANLDMCYFGAPTRPNEFVVVTMTGGRRAPFVHTPVTVFGTLSVREERREGRVTSLYALDGDSLSLRP